MKSIVIEIAATGEVKIEAVGFKGKACEKATEAMEKALGVKKDVKRKPEYNASEAVVQKIG